MIVCRLVVIACAMVTMVASLSSAASFGGSAYGGERQKNVLVIITDDYGTELWSSFFDTVETSKPATPTIDALANDGIRFTGHWGAARCHPFRTALLTGRHLMRTRAGTSGSGSGNNVSKWEWFLPEMIREHLGSIYSMAQIGKWGAAANNSGFTAYQYPAEAGFDYFEGIIGSTPSPGYWEWSETTTVRSPASDSTSTNTNYVTTETADDAIAWLATASEPWFLVVSFNAPHLPWCNPSTQVCGGPPDAVENARLMVEAMDTQLARVLNTAAVADHLDNTVVFTTADNGSDGIFSHTVLGEGKGTIYESGVNVPLIVSHGGVDRPGRVVTDIASVVDIPITILDIVGAPVPTNLPDSTGDPDADAAYTGQALVVDGVSLKGVIYGTATTPPHDIVFAEADVNRAVKDNDGYKVVRPSAGGSDILYLLPDETTDLCGGAGCPTGLSGAALTAYNALDAAMDAWEAAGP